MAKTVKKTKSAAKPTSKTPAKPMKKLAKLVSAIKKKVAPSKPAAKKTAAAKPAAPAPKAAPQKKVTAEKPATKAKGKVEGGSKAKKGKRDEELDDDLMVSDEDVGGEEIPDLSDFDETEEEVEAEESVEIDSDEEAAVAAPAQPSSEAETVLTDAEGRPYCKVRDCDQIAAVDAYCRFHYLLLWKKIQVRRKILVDGKLERYVEELTSRYPDKFLEMIKRDLRSEKDFLSAIAELEIDESAGEGDYDDDSQVLDEVRGFGSESSMSDEEEF